MADGGAGALRRQKCVLCNPVVGGQGSLCQKYLDLLLLQYPFLEVKLLLENKGLNLVSPFSSKQLMNTAIDDTETFSVSGITVRGDRKGKVGALRYLNI